MDGLGQYGLFGGLEGCLGGGLGYASTPQQLQAQVARQQYVPLGLERILQAQRITGTPRREKIEPKAIETVEIRAKQDIKLLKAGKGL